MAGMSITDHWSHFSACTDCTVPRAAASLSHSLLLSRDERNWATVLSGSLHADRRPLQRRNRISPHRSPVEGTQPCVTNADNAAVRLIECTSARDYNKSTSKCQKTEFKFEFINRSSNFQTSFNNPSLYGPHYITNLSLELNADLSITQLLFLILTLGYSQQRHIQ